MKVLLVLLASILLAGTARAAASINNDDSCDVKVGPAATLLLPYFEVDLSGTTGRTTLFTITNVTRYPQIAHVAVRTALTAGVNTQGTAPCGTVGSVHVNAIGFATIDLVASCSSRTPLDPLYYTTDLLFDNVLIGDYQQIGANPAGRGPRLAFDAAGNPMVHIRAVPEGGGAGSSVSTNLPYTFYDRYTPSAARTIDRRQPLPSTFAARYIQGGPSGYATNLSIWRKGVTGPAAACASYADNGVMKVGEFVRFDEDENVFALACSVTVSPIFCPDPRLPAASSTNTAAIPYPDLLGPDVSGWMYLNLNNGGASTYSVTRPSNGTITSAPTEFGTPRASQNWVTVSMFGNVGPSHMTAELDAAPLGSGCSPASPNGGFSSSPPLGPAGGVFVCPPGTTLTNGTTTLCTGTNANPNR